MASTITVKIKYDDNSHSYTESFNCADSSPSPEVVKATEGEVVKKWEQMGGSLRSIQIHTTVK